MPTETSATWSVTLCSWVGRPRLFSCLRCLCLATGVPYQLTNFQNKNSKLVLRELFCKKEKKRHEERKKQILHILCFLVLFDVALQCLNIQTDTNLATEQKIKISVCPYIMFWTNKYISLGRWRRGGWFFLSLRLSCGCINPPPPPSFSFFNIHKCMHFIWMYRHVSGAIRLKTNLPRIDHRACANGELGISAGPAKWKKVITLKLIKHRFPSWDPVRKHTWHYTAVTHSERNSVCVCVCMRACVRVRSVYWPWSCPQYLVRLGKSVPNWTLSRPECA